jgi:endonuclease I
MGVYKSSISMTNAFLLAQAQIALTEMQLILAAAEKPPTPEQIRLGTIERQLKEMLVRLNYLARTVEQHREKFDEWDKANKPDLDWLSRQNARIRNPSTSRS